MPVGAIGEGGGDIPRDEASASVELIPVEVEGCGQGLDQLRADGCVMLDAVHVLAGDPAGTGEGGGG